MFLKKRILVIDDEPDDKIQFREILEQQGFQVFWCQDWLDVKERFFQKAKHSPLPDIVLVDMHFYPPYNTLSTNPSMEGVLIIKKFFELCTHYHLTPPPIIGFTGRAHYMQKQDMIDAGVTDFITAEEFQDTRTLGRRLIQCIQEEQIVRMVTPFSKKAIYQIEEQIVQNALRESNNDPEKASAMLRWKITDVVRVKDRLEEKSHAV